MDHNYYRNEKAYFKYRHCTVPSCNNSSYSTPEKLFLKVPEAEQQRQQWLCAAGVITNASGFRKALDYFFCEDHFELEKDVENYLAYKMGFLKRIRLKDGCLPSKFTCQLGQPIVKCFIKMDVLEGKNILAIETIDNKSMDGKSGLLVKMGEHDVLYKSTFEKGTKCDNVQGYQKEYHKFIKPKMKTKHPQDNVEHAYDNFTLVNKKALSKDHDYCKKYNKC